MLRGIVFFEWRYHSRQVAFAAAALLFLFLGFVLSLRFGPENVAVNSPYLVMEGFGLMSLVSLIAAGIFAANAALRDEDFGMREIVHATPVAKRDFLLGRFSGAFLTTLAVAASSGLGMALGTLTPWIEPERLAALDARPYLAAFAWITVPNVLFATAVLFAVAVLTRNAIATYSTAVALYALYFVSAALTDSPLIAGSRPGGGGGALPSLLDPLGLTALFDATRYWTAAQKNTLFLPLGGVLLANRCLWIALALGVLAFTYRRFSFRARRATVPHGHEAAPGRLEARARAVWRPVSPEGGSWLASYRACLRLELRALGTKGTALLLLLWVGWALSEIYGNVLAGEYQTVTYPATSLILSALQTPATILGLIVIVYFGAEMFWREQRTRMAAVIDGTPVSGSVLIASKASALAVMLGAVLVTGVGTGFAVQVSKGFLDFRPGFYLAFLFFTGLPLLLYAAASLFLQAFSPGKYAGMVFFLLFVIFSRRAASLGLEHDLWSFAGAPAIRYSDLNGFAKDAVPFLRRMLHWSVFALLFATLASALWRRIGAPVRERLPILARPNVWARGLFVALLVTGGWVFYDTNVARAYVTSGERMDWRVEYEKAYKRIEALPRPRIASVEGEVELFPGEGRYRAAGRYGLVNETAGPIPSVWVSVRREARVAELSLSSARRSESDDRFGMVRFDFEPPLAPGARADLSFDLEIAGEPDDDSVVGNGTFLMNLRIFPLLGYRGSYELTDPRERRRRGLSGAGMAELDGDGAQSALDSSLDDSVDLALTVSTAGDQTALAPGRLEKQWREGDRSFFHYRAEVPIPNRFALASGRYAVARRRQGNVEIELYHLPAHAMNVQPMLDAASAALEVMGDRFGAYPHHELRIVEIPSYWPMAGFALPGTVYLREDRAFLTDARDPDRPDLLTRRVAHEVAHQWFGHRVQTADIEGASVIVESLTKYAELLVVERLRGREAVRRLLEQELDLYLSGRAADTYPEVPLYKAGDQSYLYYNKAAVVLHGLRDLMGEAKVDRAIRGLMTERRPTSLDLVRNLEAVANPRQKPLVEEWLKLVVLYDLRVTGLAARRRPDGRYDVTVEVAAGKTAGDERPLPLAEAVEIAVTANGKVLDSRPHLLRTGSNTIRLVLAERPSEAQVDPWISRLDRNPLDNTKEL